MNSISNDKKVKIYAAGPDVFFPDYQRRKAQIKKLCRAADMLALCPADDDPPISAGQPLSEAIYLANVNLIRQATYVMANVQNFRGFEPDSGTVFECGLARGFMKQVWCYNVPHKSLSEQIPHGQPGRDFDGNIIEDFGLGRNLMIAHGCFTVNGGIEACIVAISEWHRKYG